MKTNFRTAIVTLLMLAVTMTSVAQLPCTNPGLYIYGLSDIGEIREINMTNAAMGTTIKNSTYSGNAAASANGLAYNFVEQKFYYFKRNFGNSPQQFVSYHPATDIVAPLAVSTITNDVHTGSLNFAGTGYYTVDTDGNLHYYNILLNTWTLITSNIRDQYGLDVDSCIRQQSAGDMAIDGLGAIWLLTSSNSNYGLFRISYLPTSPVAQLNVTRIVAPTASTPTGQSFAGIAFNPTGQIYMATRSGNRLYRMNDNYTLSFIGTMTHSNIGNDLTSCSFPNIVLPVVWNSFVVSAQKDNTVKLTWEVGEENNHGFYIQYSADGANWEDLTFITSKNDGNHAYSYAHSNNFNGKQYYRIMQVNADGKSSYSEVRTVTLKNSQPVAIWPNPTSSHIRIAAQSGDNTAFVSAQVFDLSGKVMAQKQLQPATVNTINISSLPIGTYVVRIQSSNGTFYNQKISKQ